MFKPVNRNPSPAELRSFGWVMLGGLGVLGGVLLLLAWLKADEPPAPPPTVPLLGMTYTQLAVGLWIAGAGVWVASRVWLAAARVIYIGWMAGTRPIGVVMAVAVLTALFVVMLPVFALIIRRSDPLRRRLEPVNGSYWESVRPYEPTLSRMSRLF